MPDLAAFPWETLGLSGMAVLAVYLVLTGRIVPRSALEDALRREREWRDEAESWRGAHGTSEKARGQLLTELGRTTTALERLAGQKDLGVSLLRSIRSGTTDQEDDQ